MAKETIYITGAFHSKFGKLDHETIYSLYEKAIYGAIDNAGIDASEIDAVFVGNYSGGGFNNQEHIAPYGVNILPALQHKPFYRLESACASGTAAVHMAMMAIQSGQIDTALVVGVEKMTALDHAAISKVLSFASYWPDEGATGINAPCMFSEFAKGYMKKFEVGEQKLRETLATISAKAYSNAAQNPLAHIQKQRSSKEILDLPDEKNPLISWPLRLHDCSLISDGSASIVLSRKKPANEANISLSGTGSATDYLDIVNGNKATFFLEGASVAVKKALGSAGLTINNIQVAEVHDCFTITELLIYSALGLVENGKEYELLESKTVYQGGSCVINPSGGLKAKGHPIGATGVAMHALLYHQLKGTPIGLGVEGAQHGLVLNIGGSGVSNMCSVLSREK